MDIYPQDLGRVGYRMMLHLRIKVEQDADHIPPKQENRRPLARLSGLRRVWLRGSGVPEETARSAPPAFADCRRAIWFGNPGLVGALFLSLTGVWMLWATLASIWEMPKPMDWLYASWAVVGAGEVYYAVTVRPRRWFRRLHSPLTEPDVALLMKQTRDPLTRDFLSVVELLRPLPAMAEADGEKNLRRALYALGEAIEELPPQAPTLAQGDPVQIREQAKRVTDEARREPDPIVAASLERRAHSLTRRAQTMANIAILLRRNQTLREEISEQIEALRTGISALRVGSRQGAHELTELAASIQRVAAEASAIAVARTELETLETTAYSDTAGSVLESVPYQTVKSGGG